MGLANHKVVTVTVNSIVTVSSRSTKYDNFKGCLGFSMPDQWSRSDDQLEVELFDAEMFGQAGVVQVVFLLNLGGARVQSTI